MAEKKVTRSVLRSRGMSVDLDGTSRPGTPTLTDSVKKRQKSLSVSTPSKDVQKTTITSAVNSPRRSTRVRSIDSRQADSPMPININKSKLEALKEDEVLSATKLSSSKRAATPTKMLLESVALKIKQENEEEEQVEEKPLRKTRNFTVSIKREKAAVTEETKNNENSPNKINRSEENEKAVAFVPAASLKNDNPKVYPKTPLVKNKSSDADDNTLMSSNAKKTVTVTNLQKALDDLQTLENGSSVNIDVDMDSKKMDSTLTDVPSTNQQQSDLKTSEHQEEAAAKQADVAIATAETTEVTKMSDKSAFEEKLQSSSSINLPVTPKKVLRSGKTYTSPIDEAKNVDKTQTEEPVQNENTVENVENNSVKKPQESPKPQGSPISVRSADAAENVDKVETVKNVENNTVAEPHKSPKPHGRFADAAEDVDKAETVKNVENNTVAEPQKSPKPHGSPISDRSADAAENVDKVETVKNVENNTVEELQKSPKPHDSPISNKTVDAAENVDKEETVKDEEHVVKSLKSNTTDNNNWNEKVKVNELDANTKIDKIEQKLANDAQKDKLLSTFNMELYKKYLSPSYDQKDYETSTDDEEQDRQKCEFLNDEASDAGDSYKSGDSMSVTERQEMEDNQISDHGESIGSEDTPELDDRSDESVTSLDSFIAKDDQVSVVEEDDNDCSAKFSFSSEENSSDALANEEQQLQAIKKKYKRVKIVQSSDSETCDNKPETNAMINKSRHSDAADQKRVEKAQKANESLAKDACSELDKTVELDIETEQQSDNEQQQQQEAASASEDTSCSNEQNDNSYEVNSHKSTATTFVNLLSSAYFHSSSSDNEESTSKKITSTGKSQKKVNNEHIAPISYKENESEKTEANNEDCKLTQRRKSLTLPVEDDNNAAAVKKNRRLTLATITEQVKYAAGEDVSFSKLKKMSSNMMANEDEIDAAEVVEPAISKIEKESQSDDAAAAEVEEVAEYESSNDAEEQQSNDNSDNENNIASAELEDVAETESEASNNAEEQQSNDNSDNENNIASDESEDVNETESESSNDTEKQENDNNSDEVDANQQEASTSSHTKQAAKFHSSTPHNKQAAKNATESENMASEQKQPDDEYSPAEVVNQQQDMEMSEEVAETVTDNTLSTNNDEQEHQNDADLKKKAAIQKAVRASRRIMMLKKEQSDQINAAKQNKLRKKKAAAAKRVPTNCLLTSSGPFMLSHVFDDSSPSSVEFELQSLPRKIAQKSVKKLEELLQSKDLKQFNKLTKKSQVDSASGDWVVEPQTTLDTDALTNKLIKTVDSKSGIFVMEKLSASDLKQFEAQQLQISAEKIINSSSGFFEETIPPEVAKQMRERAAKKAFVEKRERKLLEEVAAEAEMLKQLNKKCSQKRKRQEIDAGNFRITTKKPRWDQIQVSSSEHAALARVPTIQSKVRKIISSDIPPELPSSNTQKRKALKRNRQEALNDASSQSSTTQQIWTNSGYCYESPASPIITVSSTRFMRAPLQPVSKKFKKQHLLNNSGEANTGDQVYTLSSKALELKKRNELRKIVQRVGSMDILLNRGGGAANKKK